ncbi:MAG: trigger factor [Spirochaetota bacterium]
MVAEKKIKELENSAVELTVSVPQETVAEEYDKTVKEYCKKVQIKGFRKGKVPASVLENKYGEALKEETMYSLIENSVEKAIKELDSEYQPLPYSRPVLSDELSLSLDPEKEFSFAVKYDVYPKIDLPEYADNTITVPTSEVPQEKIDEEIKNLQEQNSMVTEQDKAVEKDDIVTVDMAEVDDQGEIVEGTERQDFVFTVGTGYNFYKIDDDIIGMKKGDSKVIEKTFPDDHETTEYAGKTVKVQVEIKTVKVRDMPELDDEFAQDISDEYETFDDLVKATREKLEKQLEDKLRNYKVQKLYDALIDPIEADIPESMINAELENSWNSFVSQSGMGEEQILQILAYQEKTKADLLEEWRPQARKSILIQMLLEKVINDEGIEATDEDIKDLLPQIEALPDQQQKDYYKQMMKEDKKMQKAVDLLLEKNTFQEGEKVDFDDLMQDKL